MSHSIDESYAYYTEAFPKARKPYRCDACDCEIRVGDKYAAVHYNWDHSHHSTRRCLRCQTIHEHLRAIAPCEMWPDEELNCGEEYEEHWGHPPPENIAALAFMTPDEMQKTLVARKAAG